jgi:hypothetical protein
MNKGALVTPALDLLFAAGASRICKLPNEGACLGSPRRACTIRVPEMVQIDMKCRKDSWSPNSIACRSKSPPICIPVAKKKKRLPSPAINLHRKLLRSRKRRKSPKPCVRPNCARNLEVINFSSEEEKEDENDQEDIFMFEM